MSSSRLSIGIVGKYLVVGQKKGQCSTRKLQAVKTVIDCQDSCRLSRQFQTVETEKDYKGIRSLCSFSSAFSNLIFQGILQSILQGIRVCFIGQGILQGILFYSTIYPTPPSILPLMAWVTSESAGSWPSPQRNLAVGHHNPKVCSLACRWWLRLALRADQESFSIVNSSHPGILECRHHLPPVRGVSE